MDILYMFENVDYIYVTRVRLHWWTLEYNNAGVQTFSKTLGFNPKSPAPKVWHEASSTSRTHKYLAPKYQIYSPWRTGARNLCTPTVLKFC